MSILTDQIKSKLDQVFAAQLGDLPTSGPISFYKELALTRVEAVRSVVQSLAVDHGFSHLSADIDEVFDAFVNHYDYLGHHIETSRSDLDSAVAGLVADLLGLVVPDPEPSPVVDEIHGTDSGVDLGANPYFGLDEDPYFDDFEPVHDLLEESEAYYDYEPNPIVIDITDFLAAPLQEPVPTATIEADLWGVRASLSVSGAGTTIEFDGQNLLVTL